MSGDRQAGFTLTELLVTMAIASVVLGGLVYSFLNQHEAYAYNNKRADALEDMAYVIHFMSNDIRASLYSLGRDPAANVAIVNGAGANPETVAVSFKVWNVTRADATKRDRRCYLYRNKTIFFKRNHTGACNAGTSTAGFAPLMENVTHFHVWKDVAGTKPTIGGIAPADAPPGLPAGKGHDSQGGLVNGIPGYTVMIEVAVDDKRARHGKFVDVLGNNVRGTSDPRPRIWRYFQAYPGTVVL